MAISPASRQQNERVPKTVRPDKQVRKVAAVAAAFRGELEVQKNRALGEVAQSVALARKKVDESYTAALANLVGLATDLKSNSISAEIALSKSIKAGILVEQVSFDKSFSNRLVQSGIIPRRTLQYAAENNMQRFTPAQSERIVRVMRVTGLAREAFGDKADEWLDRPTTVFSGATPAEMLVNEAGARAVEMFIGQAMHGFAA
jgi:putative toxin-antitoxin system antitoxin component (TIGR02293 family)